MKIKLFALVLALILALSMVSCGDNDDSKDGGKDDRIDLPMVELEPDSWQ